MKNLVGTAPSCSFESYLNGEIFSRKSFSLHQEHRHDNVRTLKLRGASLEGFISPPGRIQKYNTSFLTGGEEELRKVTPRLEVRRGRGGGGGRVKREEVV